MDIRLYIASAPSALRGAARVREICLLWMNGRAALRVTFLAAAAEMVGNAIVP